MKRILSLLLAALLITTALLLPLSVQADGLDAPALVSASKADNRSVRIFWPRVRGAKSYEVYRSVNKKSGYKRVKKTAGFVVTDKGLSPGRTYYYKVAAVNGKKKSKYSSVKAVKLSTMKKDAAEGSYQVSYNSSNITYDAEDNAYVVKGHAYYPVTVSPAAYKKLKKGKTFKISYADTENTVKTEEFKVTEKDAYYAELKGIRATVYNKKTKETKTVSPHDYCYIDPDRKVGKEYVLTAGAKIAVNDYATRRPVSVYVKRDHKIFFENAGEYEDVDDTAFSPKENVTNGLIYVTVKNGYAVSYGDPSVVG